MSTTGLAKKPTDWPTAGMPLAWGMPDKLVETAVPLTQADLEAGSLDEATYRARLAARLEWMIDRDPNPRRAVAALVQEMEAAGVWSGESSFPTTYEALDNLVVENRDALRPLMLATDLSFPVQVRQVPAAVRAIKETDLGEWLSRAFQGASEGPMLVVSAAIDEAFADLGGALPGASAVAGRSDQPRTAQAGGDSVLTQTFEAADDAMAALTDLFGGGPA